MNFRILQKRMGSRMSFCSFHLGHSSINDVDDALHIHRMYSSNKETGRRNSHFDHEHLEHNREVVKDCSFYL